MIKNLKYKNVNFFFFNFSLILFFFNSILHELFEKFDFIYFLLNYLSFIDKLSIKKMTKIYIYTAILIF